MPSSSKIVALDLPRSLFAPPGERERDLIRQTRSALLGLEVQIALAYLADSFDQEPRLEAVTLFHRGNLVREDGATTDFSVVSNLGAVSDCDLGDEDEDALEEEERLCPGAEPEGEDLALLTRLHERLRFCDADALDSLSGEPLTRPESGEALPALMSQALSPKDFARWEADWIESQALSHPAPKPPRASL